MRADLPVPVMGLFYLPPIPREKEWGAFTKPSFDQRQAMTEGQGNLSWE